MLVYDAELELVSERGARWVPYHGFHTAYKKMNLSPDELLRAVRLPRRAAKWRQHYRKVGTRRAQAISKVCFAGAALIENGVVADIRIALGSVAPIVLRAVKTEDALRGARITPAVIATVKDTLAHEIAPIDDIRSTARISFARRAKSDGRISLAALAMTNIHAIRSKRVVTPQGVRPAAVCLRGGVIEAITAYDAVPSGEGVYDAGDSCVVMPGLVDTHVHIDRTGAHRLGRISYRDARSRRGRSDHAH